MNAAAVEQPLYVRIDHEDGTSEVCTLDDFFADNSSPELFDEDADEERVASGERVAIGGGASPLVHIQITTDPQGKDPVR